MNSRISQSWRWLPAATVALTLTISGCASQQTTGADAAPADPNATGTALPADTQTEAKPMDDGVEKLAKVIYFDYDRDDIKPQYRDVISGHAQFLRNNPQAHVKLGGHADERGSREYNLALSERRVKAVVDQLRIAGVPEAQITSTAYGEEYPAVSGHDENAWSKNRRVEFEYRGSAQ